MEQEEKKEPKQLTPEEKKNTKRGCLIVVLFVIAIGFIIQMCTPDENNKAIIEDHSGTSTVKTTVSDADKKSIGYILSRTDGISPNSLRKIVIHKNLSTDDPNDLNITIDVFGDHSKNTLIYKSASILQNIPANINIAKITIAWISTFVDKLGNENENTALFITLSGDKLRQINWKNFNSDNLEQIADSYWDHPSIR